MKINIFKIDTDKVDDLTEELENAEYDPIADIENDKHYMVLYLKRKSSESQGWIEFYKNIIDEEDYKKYSENLGSESLSGLYLIEKEGYAYASSAFYCKKILR